MLALAFPRVVLPNPAVDWKILRPNEMKCLEASHLTYFIRTLNRTQNKDPGPCSAAEIRRGWSAGDSPTSVCNSQVWWLRLESPHLLFPFPTHCKSLKAKIIKVLVLTLRGLIVISGWLTFSDCNNWFAHIIPKFGYLAGVEMICKHGIHSHWLSNPIFIVFQNSQLGARKIVQWVEHLAFTKYALFILRNLYCPPKTSNSDHRVQSG